MKSRRHHKRRARMSKPRGQVIYRQVKNPKEAPMELLPDSICGKAFLPTCIVEMDVSDAAHSFAQYLCYLHEFVSKTYPQRETLVKELLERDPRITQDLVDSCEAELIRAGFLVKNGDGTFSIKGL